MMNALLLALLVTSLLMACPAEAAQRALLIGVGDYRNLPFVSQKQGREFKDLNGPRNDVTLLRQTLIGRYGFSSNAIRVLTDREASREAILSAFKSWLIDGSSPGDLVLFYFSGHGVPVRDQNGDEDDGMDEALAPYDVIIEGARDAIDAKLIVDDELSVLLRQLKDRQVVVVIDTCYSGTATRGIGGTPVAMLEETGAVQARNLFVTFQESPSETRSIPRQLQLPAQPDIPEGHVFFSASRENQLSMEREFADGAWNGALTRAMVEEMAQQRDRTYRNLYEHVRKVIKDRYRLDQDPQIEAGSGRMLDQVAFPRDVITALQPDAPRPKPKLPVSSSLQAPTPAQVVTTERPPAPPSPAPVSTPPSGQPTVSPSAVPPQPVSTPRPPADIRGEKVLLKLEPVRGGDPALQQRLQSALARLPDVEVITEGFFDRLIRGEIKNGRYYLRLLNGIGDTIPIPSTDRLDTLIETLAPHLEYAYIVKKLAHIRQPNPRFGVTLSVTDETRRDFKVGEKIRFRVQTERDAYILLLTVDSHGNVQVIFPNRFHRDHYIRAKTGITIPDERMIRERFEFEFAKPTGEETVKLIATTRPLDLTRLGLTNLREVFPTVQGRTRSILVKGVMDQLNQQSQAATSGGERFEWSEATVVVRSHGE